MKRWFKPTRLIMNAQVDGLWHSEVEWEGKRWPHYGRFTRLERPRLFEQTWMSEATHGLESRDELTNRQKGSFRHELNAGQITLSSQYLVVVSVLGRRMFNQA